MDAKIAQVTREPKVEIPIAVMINASGIKSSNQMVHVQHVKVEPAQILQRKTVSVNQR